MSNADLILDHLERHRFTTLSVLHRMFFPGAKTADLKAALKAQVEEGVLPLERRFIGPNIPVLQRANRGKIGLVTAWSRWALLHYCCMYEHHRMRLLPAELLGFLNVQELPGIDPNTQFFCLETARRTITQVIVDFRPSASISSPVKRSVGHDMARRICDRWQRFQTIQSLSELHGAGLLSVTALVATESKKTLILQTLPQEIAGRPSLIPGKLNIHVVPELLALIA